MTNSKTRPSSRNPAPVKHPLLSAARKRRAQARRIQKELDGQLHAVYAAIQVPVAADTTPQQGDLGAVKALQDALVRAL